MNSSTLTNPHTRRTSERRRLKLLRNLDEYKICNPYRQPQPSPPLPHALSQQLNKIDYLSSTTIQMLSFPTPHHDPSQEHSSLLNMSQALNDQESRFRSLFGDSLYDIHIME